MEYDRFDRSLDEIEPVLYKLAGTHRLKQARIERWRWDEPTITLAWKGSDDIWRNITTFLAKPPTNPKRPVGHIEINAWCDEPRGTTWVRNWRHKEVKKGAFDPEQGCEMAYQQVSCWTDEMLDQQQKLSDDAGEILAAEEAQSRTP